MQAPRAELRSVVHVWCAVCGAQFKGHRRSRRYCSARCRVAAYRNRLRDGTGVTIATGPGWELRRGRYQTALANVAEVDAVIADAPYSARTHAGHNGAVASVRGKGEAGRRALSYAAWTPRDVRRFCRFWNERCRGWICAMTDSVLAPVWRRELEHVGRYAFAPVPCVIPGMSVRLSGDGPSSWHVSLIVARPRSAAFARWGTLPGAYHSRRGAARIGGKPLDLMSAIVRDYSRPGDLIVDPCAGLATTGIAALSLGRRFIGAEVDATAYERAAERLRSAVQFDLLAGAK